MSDGQLSLLNRAPRHMLGDARLQDTLDYAKQYIPFYVGRSSGCAYRSLSDFPVIDADKVACHQHEFYYLEEFPDFLATTGGTSGGKQKFLIRNYRELDTAFRDCFGLGPGQRISVEGYSGFTLNLTDFQHGLTLPPRHGQPVLSMPLESGRQLAMVEAMLREGLFVNKRRIGVSRIVGSATKLRALTAYCAALGEGLDYHVHEIVSTAFYSSKSWKEMLRDYWGAEVRTAYGLSEFPEANTIACRECGLYHLPKTVHAEILSLDGDYPATPQAKGGTAQVGRLVLTSLLPYRKAMPLIRYDTRDIVQIELDKKEHAAGPAFKFLGRQGQVLMDEKNRSVLLTPFDVVDIAEAVLGGNLVRDDNVETVMKLGIGDIAPDFSGIGYPRIRISYADTGTRKNSYRVIVESHCQERELGIQFRRAISERVHAQSAPYCDLETLVVEPNGLSQRGLAATLI